MISRSNRYERWDGSQQPFGRDAEDLFDRLAEDLFQGGDFDYALHRLMSRGWRDRQGRKLPGFEEMLERLRQKRLQQLKRYNLNDVFGNIRERLNDILRRERQGINERLEQAPESAKRVLQRITKKKLQELDRLPEDVGGAIRELNDYEFMDEGAAQAFQKLMEELKQQVSQTYFKNMTRTRQPLRLLWLGIAAAAGSALLDGAAAGDRRPRIGPARGLPGTPTDARAIGAAAATAGVGRPPGRRPDE